MHNKRNYIFLGMIGLLGYSSAAFATDNVSSPYIEKGKLELQYRGGYDIDDSASKDRKKLNKFIVGYGVTDRFKPELRLVVADNPNKDAKITGAEAILRYQFFKPEEAWAAAAIDGNYKISTESNKADKFELKLLLGKDFKKFSHLANIGFEEEIGENSRNGLSLKTAWKSNYKVKDYFAPGFEFFGDTVNLRDSANYNDYNFRVGPNISGKITENIKYDAGYLFGISENAVDGRVKLILSYSKVF